MPMKHRRRVRGCAPGCGGPGPGHGRDRGRGRPRNAGADPETMIVKDDNAAVLKTKGRIKCSQPGCPKSFSNKAGYDYHVKRCGVNPEDIQKYYCPHCPDKVYTSKAGLDIHRRTIHETPEPILDQGEDLGRHRQRKAAQKALAQVKLLKDAICDVPGIKKDRQKKRKRELDRDDFLPEDGESEDDDEDDDCDEINRSSLRRDINRNAKLHKMSYYYHCERLCLMQEILFPGLRSKVSTWPKILERPDDLTSESLGKVIQDGTKKDVESLLLPLYSATEIKRDTKNGVKDGHLTYFAFNIGGTVRSIAWCPVPLSEDNACQYAAFSPYNNEFKHQQTLPSYTGSSCIQIWGFGPLHNEREKPELKLCILHDAGRVNELKWCPSGCYDDPSLVESKGDDRFDQRLGLLSAACSNGSVLIYSIPHPPEDQMNSHLQNKVCKPVPSLVLSPGMEKKNADSSFGQCLCLDWQQRKPHPKLAAGFSSGAIAIWNVEYQSSFLVRQSKIDDSIILHPIQVFTAHNGPVLTISFCPADNSFMCSSSRNRMMEFWDIHQPGIPICSRLFRSPPQTCQWLSQYNAVLTKEDVSLPRIVLQEGSANNPAQIFSQQCYVTDVTYSEWLNCLAVSDKSGKIEICKMSKQWPGNHKVKHKKMLVRSPSSNDLSDVCINNDVIYKLQWSPNKASCKWFLAGGKSGIVRLYHLPSKFIESR
ncbi:uncharacterized protein LOC121410061 isoform X2 [Lytechinus variegatus]|uniref:uncharacterized protein LOC121410061 isoform X2 n=1 Tax=Lytechinus variegatus TaxID=7654 RepID=UPI001BB20C86|nr:uncharacterized protein LOC121410061 isoform X2 [Lytechinus variegatus]